MHKIVDNYKFQSFLGFTLHNLHWLADRSCTVSAPLYFTFTFYMFKYYWQHTRQHNLCETLISFIIYYTNHIPFANRPFLYCADWDMCRLTCLAPHNELVDRYCHHVLIIPKVQMVSVMSNDTVFHPWCKAGIDVMRRKIILPLVSYSATSTAPILYLHFQ